MLLAGYDGFVNASEMIQISDTRWQMRPGVFRVLKDGGMGVVDSTGKVLVPFQYDQVYDLDDNNYVKVLKNLKIGLYHLDKGLILPAEYDQIWPFKDGKARILKNRLLGYTDMMGHVIIPCEYSHINAERNGTFRVIRNGQEGLLDQDGNILLPPEYQKIWPFENGYARVLKDGKMGMVDISGREIVPAIYMELSTFDDGVARGVIDDQTVWLDTLGRYVDKVEVAPEVPDVKEQSIPEQKPEQGEERPSPAIRIGNDNVVIRNEDGVKEITILSGSSSSTKKRKRKRRFHGHLDGVHLGFNSYLNADQNEDMPAGYEFMEVIPEKSVEVAVYPVGESFGLIGSCVGLVGAIGLQYNNYRFSFDSGSELASLPVDWFPAVPETASVSKTKLTVLSLNVPLMLEIQIPESRNPNKSLYLSAGVVGSVRLRSHTKVVFYDESSQKKKNHDDFNLNAFRYTYMARLGYNSIGIYATYSPVSLFEKDEGPELYPYSVGLTFNF